jgi:hypothetical protein
MVSLALSGPDSQGQLECPESLRPELHAFLAAVLRDGARCYVRNVHEEFGVVRLDGCVLPLVVNHGGTSSCYLTSPLCHYANYRYDLLRAAENVVGKRSMLAELRALRAFYRATGLNRVVYVNNWLLSAQPTVHLDAAHVGALTRRLTELYPSYAVLFKGIEPHTAPALSQAVAAAGYEAIAHRQVYCWDPRDRAALRRSNIKWDLGLLKRTRYHAGWAREGVAADSRRLRQLYSALYEEKYSRFNLQYTEAFFGMAQQSHLLDFFLIEEDSRIDGFAALFCDCAHLTASMIGHDPAVPRREGLYRLGIIALMREAMDRGQVLNLGSGADAFKMLRGARPRLEYEAVYARHLPLARRLPWRLLPHLTRAYFKETLARFEN